MAPIEDEVEEEPHEQRFVEEEEETSEPWKSTTPAVFLSPDWQSPGQVSDALDCTDVLNLGSFDFTLLATVQFQAEAPECRILSREGAWLFAASGAGVRFVGPPQPVEDAPEAAEAAAAEPRVGTTRLDDGEWHHIAVVFADGTSTLFVDGQQDGEDAVEVCEGPGQIMLGQAEISGALKDVQVFQRALSSRQIADLASGSKDLGTGLDLVLLPEQVHEYWKLKARGEGARELLLPVAADPLQREFQREVLVDLFEEFLEFAESVCLTARKTAVAVRILKAVLDMMHEPSKSPLREGMTTSIYECFEEFKRLLLRHSYAAATAAKAPEEVKEALPSTATLGVFTTAEVRSLMEFATGSIFQQFVLFHYVLVDPQDQKTTHVEVEVVQPFKVQDLARAKSLSDKAAKAKAIPKRKVLSRTQSQIKREEEPQVESLSLDETLAQLPKDLSIEEHHDHSTKAAEVTATTSIRRHDQELKKP